LKIFVGDILGDFAQKILNANPTIYENPTLTDSSNNTTDASGLYKSTDTNEGNPTYYFRGNVENNYIDFAGFTWRVVRINEDGTIRLVMQDVIKMETTYSSFNSVKDNKENMYYTNSNIKSTLEAWYQTNIVEEGFSDSVVSGKYFCEQAKVAVTSDKATGSEADMIVYSNYKNPNFKCEKDANDKGLVDASVGLLNYDEVLHAGGYLSKVNKDYYLYNTYGFHTMSTTGFYDLSAGNWRVCTTGYICSYDVSTLNDGRIRPVINLKSDITVTGTGSSGDHWVVQ